MSDTDRIRLSYIQESTFGGALSSTTLKDLRLTGETLNQATTMVESKEIRSDRQVVDVIRTQISGQGGIQGEMSASTYDDLFLGAMLAAAWSSPVTVGPITTISAATSDNSFNDSGSGFGSMVANQWIKVSGFANAANNGLFKIITKTSAKLVVKGGTGALVTEAATPAITIVLGAQIVNGVTKTSFYIERGYTDLTNILACFKGMMVSQWGMQTKADDIVNCNFDFMGQKETDLTATGGVGYTTPNTNEVMSGVATVVAVEEGKLAAMSQLADVGTFNFTVNNNLRNRLRLGTLGPFSLGAGGISISGSTTMYFSTSAMIQKYLNFTESALALPLLDSTGKGYVFDFPAVKFNRGQRIAGGQDQDVMADMGFMAKMDATEGITLRIVRF